MQKISILGEISMKYNPDIHKRRTIRLKDYDYSKKGMYYITICSHNREQILSKIMNLNMTVGADAHICPYVELTNIGNIVEKYLTNINNSYQNVELVEYVIMPNHLHFIVNIEQGSMWASTPTVSKIVQTFKILVSKTVGYSIWQRNYYEHIIRNENELYKIIEYIKYNPINWVEDKYNVT